MGWAASGADLRQWDGATGRGDRLEQGRAAARKIAPKQGRKIRNALQRFGTHRRRLKGIATRRQKQTDNQGGMRSLYSSGLPC